MMAVEFNATIELNGKTATGIEVPPEVMAELGGKRVPVTVTINGYSYQSTIGSMGGRSLIPISAEHRGHAGVNAGDTVTVGLVPDTAARTIGLPDDLAEALTAEPRARAFFDGLAASHKKEYVRWVNEPKKPETRQARLAKTIELLVAGKNRH
jgi:hypothetical protein